MNFNHFRNLPNERLTHCFWLFLLAFPANAEQITMLDYSGLIASPIKAVKAENGELRAQVASLDARPRGLEAVSKQKDKIFP